VFACCREPDNPAFPISSDYLRFGFFEAMALKSRRKPIPFVKVKISTQNRQKKVYCSKMH